MRHQIVQKPDFSAVRIAFDQPGEQLVAESSSMLARDTTIDMKTQLQGGLFAAAKRKQLVSPQPRQTTAAMVRAKPRPQVQAPAPRARVAAKPIRKPMKCTPQLRANGVC